jgi:hypothetical protein
MGKVGIFYIARRRICIFLASAALIILHVALLAVHAEDIQKPAVSGYFYPKDRKSLQEMIDGFLDKADPKHINGRITAIISPHAGYVYSGQVAAYGFKLLKDKPYSTVVIVAPSHHHMFKGLAVLNKDSYMTPLGKMPIDRGITRKLLSYDEAIDYYPQAFSKEHSAEVEIPFIQQVLPQAKLVVILTGSP